MSKNNQLVKPLAFKKIGLLFICLFFSFQALAQDLSNISPAQIEQFSQLPPAVQQQLANQYGVDISTLEQLASGVDASPQTIGAPGEALVPVEAEEVAENPELSEPIVEEDAPELVRYGLSLFDRNVSTFAPVDNAPVPSNYVIGPGDSFNVLLYGSENQSLALTVDREGVLNFPRLGVISVAGLTFTDAKELIEARVSEQLIGAEAVVSAGRLRAINVFMSGEVNTPGAYSVSALTTVTQALFVAGGVSNIGSLRNIQVRRLGETVATFDAYKLLLEGDASDDVRLQSGDVLFVPPAFATASVDGAIRRPAIYELIEGQTIADLVSMAGGYDSSAYLKLSTLARFDRAKELPEILNIDLSDDQSTSMTLVDGDYLRILETGADYANGITVSGAVLRPGAYAYETNIRVSDLISGIDTHLTVDVDLNYALVVSIKNERLDIEVKPFNLGEAILNPSSPDDLLLNPRDQILVFDLTDVSERDQDLVFDVVDEEDQLSNRAQLLAPVIAKIKRQARENEPVQVVSIGGAVKAPGEYPLKEGDRLNTLIEAAGGLTENAFLDSAELQRIVVDQKGFADTEIVDIDLGNRFSDGVDNPILLSRDSIYIRAIPNWNPDRSVTIEGEVRFPGTYKIGPSETITDLVRRAGGLTEVSFPTGAVFTRQSARDQQLEQISNYIRDIRQSVTIRSITLEENQTDLEELELALASISEQENLGRLIIDMPSILLGDTSSDIILQDEDSLFIPMRSEVISVVGEVRREGIYRYQDSLTAEDYLELSAGISQRADDEQIYIVKPDGSVMSLSNKSSIFSFDGYENELSPGDTIVVPVNENYRDTIGYWSTITTIVYQTGIALAAIVAIL